MRRCDYCGKENEDTTPDCIGCATPLPVIPESPDTPPITTEPVLRAGRATAVFAIMFAAQMLGGVIGGIIVVLWASTHGVDLNNKELLTTLVNTSPLTLSVVVLAGSIAMIGASLALIRPAIKDTTPTGAAWVIGSRSDLRHGFFLGLAVGLVACLINVPLSMVMHPKSGPLGTMAATHGIPQITVIILAVLIVPAPEELLFRGVIYGGYLRSFGPRAAVILTTVLFLLMHVTELIHFLPSTIGIGALALVALRMRLRASAIGPAVAVHVGYNLVVTLIGLVFSYLPAH